MDNQPTVIGPYRIIEPLGHGGMGIVYRAKDLRTGELVALKTVRVVKKGMLRSIRQEIRALARIHHPGIVRIIDEGIQSGLPWYAMELLDGVTLRRFRTHLIEGSESENIEESERQARHRQESAAATETASYGWWTWTLHYGDTSNNVDNRADAAMLPAEGLGNRSLQRVSRRSSVSREYLITVLTLLRRLCAPLSYLHGEGIVHRDLKPDNIIIRSNGMPVLVDFGLMYQFTGEVSRESLTVEGGSSGTVIYMAPEQIRGDFIDARADLYALGCILYELLTGLPPFGGTSHSMILRAHLYESPARLSESITGVPAEVDELLSRLLAKDANNRLGYADDLAVVLARLGAEDGLAAKGPSPRAYLYKPTLVGRKPHLQQLMECLDQLQAGTGSIVLIRGESGVGKTRLAMELGHEASQRRILVLAGQCMETGGRPLEVLLKPLQAIADLCLVRGQKESDRLLGRRGKVLALYQPAIGALPGSQKYPEPAELPAEAARLRLFNYLIETGAALAVSEPVLLILDDLQWADELTLGFLTHILRIGPLTNLPLLILGTYRPEEMMKDLETVTASPLIEEVNLERMDEEEIAAMVGDMLSLSPQLAAFRRFLARYSEGNPFFVAEYLRTAVEEALLKRDELGNWHIVKSDGQSPTVTDFEALPLPGSLQDLVDRRLQGLPHKARHVVDGAAVIGREISFSLLLQVTDLQETELLDINEELVRRQVFEQNELGIIRFSHDKIRKVAYDRIDEELRPSLHQAVAKGIERYIEADRAEFLADLGWHWENASDFSRAKKYYRAAARRASKQHALMEAERLYRAYLKLTAEPCPESISVRNDLGHNVLQLLGRNIEAIQEHKQAIEEAKRLTDRRGLAENIHSLGTVLCRTGQFEEPRSLFEQALAIALEIGDRLQAGQILLNLANLNKDQGRIEEALAFYDQALEAAREIRSQTLEGKVLGSLAVLNTERGQIAESRLLYEKALAIARQSDDRRREGITLGNLACLNHNQGWTEQAKTLYEQSRDIAQEVGDRRSEMIALSNLAALHSDMDLDEKAQEQFEQSLTIAREVADRFREGIILSNLANLLHNQGRVPEALQLYEQALIIHREVGNYRFEGVSLCDMASLIRRSSPSLAAAHEKLNQAEKIFRKVEDRLCLAFTLCELGHISLARADSAQPWLQQAEKICEQLGVDPESKLIQALRHLQRAQQAFDLNEKERLYKGELCEDLPPKLKLWLEQNKKLP
ncbi:tetratricopeptide repeat protein, partial [candidate division CSSED10-310 bacterium]